MAVAEASSSSSIAPGYRFYPTEEELISFYLHKKLQQLQSPNQESCDATTASIFNRIIPLIDIYQVDPWHLPHHCGHLCRGDTEQWFFFTPSQDRASRPRRTTASGYWKATGSPSHVYASGSGSDGREIGVKKSMVFYKGKAPVGTKTKWKMNEYTAIEKDPSTSVPQLRNEVKLCRVYVVSGSTRAFDRRPQPQPEAAGRGR